MCSSFIASDESDSKYGKYKKLAVISGLVVILDQITKILILKNLPLYHSITVIPGFFNITHIHNPGGAFGFMAHQDSNLRNFLFLFLASVAVCVIFYFYKNTHRTQPFLASGFALILGGAIGNLIDRIRFGKVVDFLDFYVSNHHWPAFNVADSAITVGVTIFIFHLLFRKMP
ncbi:MAG: signal peptidase II [Desulfobacteraceae bacterium]|nr:signal peptidase II [Desulfobacteraceae bacterium]MDH3882339.1 signal peptidase II [Desulfobacteraceae bacterium]